jgi:hypothetical protein
MPGSYPGSAVVRRTDLERPARDRRQKHLVVEVPAPGRPVAVDLDLRVVGLVEGDELGGEVPAQ